MGRRRICLILVLVFAAMLCQDRPRARAADEYPVKAAFIFHFTQFVEWPADSFTDSKAPLEICVLGSDPFRGALERAVAGKIVNGHPLVVRHLLSVDDLSVCHILFIAADAQDQFAAVQQKLTGKTVLTIGESDDFNATGGMIRLLNEQNHIRFDINRGAAERARLRVSAKLLKLARAVMN